MIIPEKVRCIRCSTLFEVGQAAGLTHHLLHCNRCGREKTLKTEEILQIFSHTKYGTLSHSPSYKGNPRTASEALDTLVNDPKYRFLVEHHAGLCICGSLFKFPGKARCPRCRSSVYRIESPSFIPELLTQ